MWNLTNLLIKKHFVNNLSLIRYNSTAAAVIRKKVCIVGSGPAGFYAAQYILKNLADCDVDIIERLPVPFGLVRFGVAPDHPEVKNVISTFTKTAENPHLRFLGNLTLGKDFTLKDLREKYHAVLLTYGAEKDRKLNIPNEDNGNVITARKFVAWYNGLPGAENLNPNLDSKTVILIGQGNVAVDVARMLLKPIDYLKTTDVTEFALETFSRSKVEKVFLVGRRGPLQAAFTIKELREMLKLPNVTTLWRNEDFEGIKEVIPNLQRPRKRLTELMLSSLDTPKDVVHPKQFIPIFLRSPKAIQEKHIELTVNKLEKDTAIPTNNLETLPADLIFRSIGYKSICVDNDINFDEKAGHVRNKLGRVFQKNSQDFDKGLYVAGWLATGPTGVILTTMNGAFAVAKSLCDDIKANAVDCTQPKPGLDVKDKRVVTWKDWEKIDKAEMAAGKKLGKPREKFVKIEDMLKAAGI